MPPALPDWSVHDKEQGEPKSRPTWSTGLMSCCAQPGGVRTCFNAFVCPCYVFGHNIAMLRFKVKEELEDINAEDWDLKMRPTEILFRGDWVRGCLAWPFTLCCLHLGLRSQIRKSFGMNQSKLFDCLTTTCCCCCAMVQERRELLLAGVPSSAKSARPAQMVKNAKKQVVGAKAVELAAVAGGSQEVYMLELPQDELAMPGGYTVKVYSDDQQRRLGIDKYGNGPWKGKPKRKLKEGQKLDPIPVTQQILLGSDYSGTHFRVTIPFGWKEGQKVVMHDLTKGKIRNEFPDILLEVPAGKVAGQDFIHTIEDE